jgi:hypothetical protein
MELKCYKVNSETNHNTGTTKDKSTIGKEHVVILWRGVKCCTTPP